jgi:hydroxyethylthiazole kinase-like uncharacterized protein yjeF
MAEFLTSAQMRAIEQAEVAAGRVGWLGLMERAVGEIARVIRARHPAPGRARVLCGPGNNGGDGFGTACALRAAGWQVEVFALGDPAAQDGAAGEMVARWGAPVRALAEAARQGGRGAPDPAPDLVVDAVFGIGLTRPVPAEVAAALAACPGADLVAVDTPSGLSADTGAALLPEGAPAPRADLTITFHRMKPGHVLADGPGMCGAVEVVDIGLAEPVPGAIGHVAPPDAGAMRAALLGPDGHKYDRGHALVLGGGVARGGAGRLAARAALRAGAGLVTLAVPPAALIENAARLDAVMLRPLDGPAALSAMLEDPRLSAICLGPGLGTGAAHGARTRALVAAALETGRPAVLDADALTAHADEPWELFAALHPRAVLTPHAGEFARLFPDLAPDPAAGRSAVDAARAAAERAGAVVLLKGPATVIAAPDGRAAIHAAVYRAAAPWLATAGTGDVLSGMIAGLCARPGLEDPWPRAGLAAWLHAACARAFGPGLIAEDLPDRIPEVLRAHGVG